MTSLRAVLLAASLIVVAGCMSHRERQHVYALDAAVDPPRSAEAAPRSSELQLQRVLVPDYLDTTGILLRADAHEIRESSTGRFGERLSMGVTHALRSQLAARLPLYTITVAQPTEKSARQILVTVDEFDVWQNGRCVLVANWSILGADRRAVLSADRGTFIAGATSGATSNDMAIVAAMADALSQLAERIASKARALPP